MTGIGNVDWDFIMASGGGADYSQQAVPFQSPVASSISLHKAVQLLFLSICVYRILVHCSGSAVSGHTAVGPLSDFLCLHLVVRQQTGPTYSPRCLQSACVAWWWSV